MKRIIRILTFTIILLVSFEANAQTYAKINLAGLPLGMINGAAEARISDKITLQPEFFISPWKSFFGNRLQIYSFNLEARYYFKESFKHFYVGGNTGIALFDLQKWNYVGSNKYQRGYSLLFGITLGYQYQINERFNMDFYLGGASSQGFYHGYDIEKGERYEKSTPWNKSGEIIPYKVGVTLSYKLK